MLAISATFTENRKYVSMCGGGSVVSRSATTCACKQNSRAGQPQPPVPRRAHSNANVPLVIRYLTPRPTSESPFLNFIFTADLSVNLSMHFTITRYVFIQFIVFHFIISVYFYWYLNIVFFMIIGLSLIPPM